MLYLHFRNFHLKKLNEKSKILFSKRLLQPIRYIFEVNVHIIILKQSHILQNRHMQFLNSMNLFIDTVLYVEKYSLYGI